jgi:hypothetical protein
MALGVALVAVGLASRVTLEITIMGGLAALDQIPLFLVYPQLMLAAVVAELVDLLAELAGLEVVEMGPQQLPQEGMEPQTLAVAAVGLPVIVLLELVEPAVQA